MRRKIKHQSKHQSILFDRILNSQREDYGKCMLYSEEKWYLYLSFSKSVQIAHCCWLMLRNRFGTRLCQQTENQSWKLRSYLRSSSKLAWSGASDRESHKFVNINSAVANKKPCKTSMNISNLEETDIPLVLQQSKGKLFLIVQYVWIGITRRVGMHFTLISSGVMVAGSISFRLWATWLLLRLITSSGKMEEKSKV